MQSVIVENLWPASAVTFGPIVPSLRPPAMTCAIFGIATKLLLGGVHLLWGQSAQGTSAVSGTVRDGQGGTIAEARITLTDKSKPVTRDFFQ
jgi:hypothetical protein